MTGAEAPGLSVVVVNFETPDRVAACLAAVWRAADALVRARGVETEAIVVDNGSRDGSRAAIEALDPPPRLVALEANRGFAAGANAGIAQATGAWILLLNSDTLVDTGALIALLDAFAADPRLGVAGAQLVHPDGRLQNAAHAYPTLWQELVPTALLQVLRPGRYPSKRFAHVAPYRVEAVQGAALMVARAVVERIGPLCEAYFFFLEETDWCQRAAAAGFSVCVVPAARVVHEGGASSKRRDAARTRIEFDRSLQLYHARRAGPGAARVLTAIRLLRALGGVCVGVPLAAFSERQRARLHARLALVRWYLAGRPADAGLEGALGAARPGAPTG